MSTKFNTKDLSSFESMKNRYFNLLAENYDDDDFARNVSLFLLDKENFNFFEKLDKYLEEKPSPESFTDVFVRVVKFCESDKWDDIFLRVDRILSYIKHTDSYHIKDLILYLMKNEPSFVNYFDSLLRANKYKNLINCFSFYVANYYELDSEKALEIFWYMEESKDFVARRECATACQWFKSSPKSSKKILKALQGRSLDSDQDIKREAVTSMFSLITSYEEVFLPAIKQRIELEPDSTILFISNPYIVQHSEISKQYWYKDIFFSNAVVGAKNPDVGFNLGKCLYFATFYNGDFSIVFEFLERISTSDKSVQRNYKEIFRNHLKDFLNYQLSKNYVKVMEFLTDIFLVNNYFFVRSLNSFITEMWIKGGRTPTFQFKENTIVEDNEFKVLSHRVLGISIHFGSKSSLLFCLDEIASNEHQRKYLSACFFEILGRDFLIETCHFLERKIAENELNKQHWAHDCLSRLLEKSNFINKEFKNLKEHFPPESITLQWHKFEREQYSLAYKEAGNDQSFLFNHVKNYKFKYGKKFGTSHKGVSSFQSIQSPVEKIPLLLKHDEVTYDMDDGRYRYGFKEDVLKK